MLMAVTPVRCGAVQLVPVDARASAWKDRSALPIAELIRGALRVVKGLILGGVLSDSNVQARRAV